MKKDQDLIIAMIGTADQVTFMRMGGIGAWRIIREDGNVAEQVRAALNDLRGDSSIGIIIIPEEWKGYISDLFDQISLSKSTVPVIVEIPTLFDQGVENIKEFYQSYAKKLIGFSIEI
jgi:vacuolar-type H+-ATPase subunit F/Vma7